MDLQAVQINVQCFTLVIDA